MTDRLRNHRPDNEADWLDDLLRSVAEGPEPVDAGFNDAVLRALPLQAAVRRGGIGMHWINVCALAAASSLLVLLLPTAVDLLTASGASELAPSEALEHSLPPIALLAWLVWWSLQRPFAD
jgi:hypothetical protein